MNEKIDKNENLENKEALKLLKKQQKLAKKKAKDTMKNYKEFAIKGNALDLAIGVVIGSAFTNIVNTIVSSTITPIISILTNKVDLSTLFVALDGNTYESLEQAKKVGAVTLNYGELLNAFINFFIISFVLFLIVSFIRKSSKKEEVVIEKTTKDCPYCLSSVPIKASKCMYCTSELNNENLDN